MNPEQNKQAFLYIHTSIMQNSLKKPPVPEAEKQKKHEDKKYFRLVKPMKMPRKVKKNDQSSFKPLPEIPFSWSENAS